MSQTIWSAGNPPVICTKTQPQPHSAFLFSDDSNEEVVEFSTMPTEASRLTVQEAPSGSVLPDSDVSVLTAFTKKAAID